MGKLSISRSPKLLLLFLFNNRTMSSRFLECPSEENTRIEIVRENVSLGSRLFSDSNFTFAFHAFHLKKIENNSQ